MQSGSEDIRGQSNARNRGVRELLYEPLLNDLGRNRMPFGMSYDLLWTIRHSNAK